MGTLISNLKEVNEDIQIYICELVPTMKHEGSLDTIKDFNAKLIEWSYNNNIHIVKTDLPFKVGTGEIDDMCIGYCEQTKGHNILNRYGVIRLLDTIIKQYPDLDICLTKNELLKVDSSREHVYKTVGSRYISRDQDGRSDISKRRNYNHQDVRSFYSSN